MGFEEGTTHVKKSEKGDLPNCSWQSSLGSKRFYFSLVLFSFFFFCNNYVIFFAKKKKNRKAISKEEIATLDSFISQMSK